MQNPLSYFRGSPAALSLLAFGVVLISGCTRSAYPLESPLPPNLQRISKAVASDSTLWFLSGTSMGSIDLRGEEPQWLDIDGAVFDLSQGAGGVIYALVATDQPRRARILKRETNDAWIDVAQINLERHERPLGLAISSSRAAVLTTQSIHVGPLASLVRHPIDSEEFGWTLQPSLAVLPNETVYWGLNQGEWGGGLLRWKDDTLESIQRRDSTDLCSGPLNSACDPVTAVLEDTTQPGCVIASVGLRHFQERGRLLRICDGAVEVFYDEKYPDSGWGGSTRAFFGLAPSSTGFWAISGGQIFHFDKVGGDPERFDTPELSDTGGLWMSTGISGVLVLSTQVNWVASMSGPTPLLVPIEPER